jgi:hypothetical protein
MRNRVTRELLDRLVRRVNELTGNPLTAWEVGEWDEETQSVKVSANVGNYHIAKIYGGYRIERMDNTGGTSTDPLGSDVYTAREIEIQLRAFIAGLENKQWKPL